MTLQLFLFIYRSGNNVVAGMNQKFKRVWRGIKAAAEREKIFKTFGKILVKYKSRLVPSEHLLLDEMHHALVIALRMRTPRRKTHREKDIYYRLQS